MDQNYIEINQIRCMINSLVFFSSPLKIKWINFQYEKITSFFIDDIPLK